MKLTAWLEADDASGRPMGLERLRDLLDMLPVPSDGLTFLGGETSATSFDEVRRCYLDGSYLAVVLLCLAYIERELAEQGRLIVELLQDVAFDDTRWFAVASFMGVRSKDHSDRVSTAVKAESLRERP